MACLFTICSITLITPGNISLLDCVCMCVWGGGGGAVIVQPRMIEIQKSLLMFSNNYLNSLASATDPVMRCHYHRSTSKRVTWHLLKWQLVSNCKCYDYPTCVTINFQPHLTETCAKPELRLLVFFFFLQRSWQWIQSDTQPHSDTLLYVFTALHITLGLFFNQPILFLLHSCLLFALVIISWGWVNPRSSRRNHASYI